MVTQILQRSTYKLHVILMCACVCMSFFVSASYSQLFNTDRYQQKWLVVEYCERQTPMKRQSFSSHIICMKLFKINLHYFRYLSVKIKRPTSENCTGLGRERNSLVFKH